MKLDVMRRFPLFTPHNIKLHLFPASGNILSAFRVRKTTQHGFFPDGENFPVDP